MLNSVNLVGRISRDLELKYSGTGTAVLNFNLAVNRTFTNQSGEREADFINCVTFKKQAENMANYLRKGALIAVNGRIQTRSYDGQNGRVWVTEVVANEVTFLEPKNSGQARNSQFEGDNYDLGENNPF
jgi:single-strand DNA-binding protein